MQQKPDKIMPALYGGIIMGVISGVPGLNFLNCLCCAGILLGGVLAVMFYKNNFTPDTPPFSTGECMAVGAIAGGFGAIIGTFISSVFTAILGNMMGEWMMEFLKNSNFQFPEETWDNMEKSINEPMSVFKFFIGLVFALIIYPLFGMLGGLLGYAFFKPKGPYMPPPMPPPQNFYTPPPSQPMPPQQPLPPPPPMEPPQQDPPAM